MKLSHATSGGGGVPDEVRVFGSVSTGKMSKVAAMAWLGMGFRTNDRTPCIVDCPLKVLVLVGVAEWLSLHGQSGFGLYLAKSKRWGLIGRLTLWSLVYIESFDLGLEWDPC